MTGICSQIKPDWDGAPISMLGEAIALASTPIPLILFLASAIAIRFRSQWGTLALVVIWSFYVAFLTILDPGAAFASARIEGCIGSPTLFIAAVAAICVGMILYTAPNEARKT